MEEQALYKAILASPHDDTPRLVYADWLEENADLYPEVVARTMRARAEFIRIQCTIARTGPAGWRQAQENPDPTLARRERRLRFTHGQKWRRAVPVSLASSPFDRGFLRPYRALTPITFPLTTDEPLRVAPLWDIHLYASDWHNDPHADRGQYDHLLNTIAQSPALERIGWLKVSFFHTSTTNFLLTGRFYNVETLVLNYGPFPEVLAAVAANESFRSLRYVSLGNDTRIWTGQPRSTIQIASTMVQLVEANRRHRPYGGMRLELGKIALTVTNIPDPTIPGPFPWAPTEVLDVRQTQRVVEEHRQDRNLHTGLLLYVLIFIAIALAVMSKDRAVKPRPNTDAVFRNTPYDSLPLVLKPTPLPPPLPESLLKYLEQLKGKGQLSELWQLHQEGSPAQKEAIRLLLANKEPSQIPAKLLPEIAPPPRSVNDPK